MRKSSSIALVFTILLYGFIHYFIGYKLIRALPESFSFVVSWCIGLVLGGLFVCTSLVAIFSKRYMGVFVGKVGKSWPELSIMVVAILWMAEGIKILAAVIPISHNGVRFLSSSSLVWVMLFLFLLFCGYGLNHARQIQVTHYKIKLAKSGVGSGLKMVMCSDVHLGYVIDAPRLRDIVRKMNERNPDLVVIAGDLFDGNFAGIKDIQEIRRLLDSVKAKYGTYLAWGNHDAGSSFKQIKSFIQSTNIVLLEDEVKVIENKVILIGRRDSCPNGNQNGKRQDITLDLQAAIRKYPELPVVVLDHRPSNAKEYGPEVDLILSGHTHRGQIFPMNLVMSGMYSVDYGYYQTPTYSQGIVSSGVGTGGPAMRVGSKNEIVEIEVEFVNPI